MVIGVTGVFGSGKSTVLEMLRYRGARVLSADEIVGELLEDPGILSLIRENFGDSVMDQRGGVNRSCLAERVFARPEERRRLENLLHPAVISSIKRAIRNSPKEGLLAVEVPLLFETGCDKLFDYVICVSSEPGVIISRLVSRGFSEKEVKNRSAAQMSLREKEKKSDLVIRNNGSLSETARQVDECLAVFNQRKR